MLSREGIREWTPAAVPSTPYTSPDNSFPHSLLSTRETSPSASNRDGAVRAQDVAVGEPEGYGAEPIVTATAWKSTRETISRKVPKSPI